MCRKMKKVTSYLLVFSMVLMMFAGTAMNADAKAKKASLKTKKISMTVGQKKTVALKNKNKKAKYSYKTSAKKVVLVSKAGKLTAKKAGTAKITVKETLKKKSRTVGKVTVTVKAKKNVVSTTEPAATPVPTATPTVAPTIIPPIVTPIVTATPTPTPVPTPIVSETINKDMVSKSLVSTGNNARFKAVIEKAKAGEDVTVAYLGGSITEGAGANPQEMCYAQTSAEAFAAKYGKGDGSNVHFLDAGIGGTPSSLGTTRYDRDITARLENSATYPDILFVEFAVNDNEDCTDGAAYEGIIRKALNSGSAVFLVFSVFRDGVSGAFNTVRESQYIPYGVKYDLPMISMNNAIKDYYTLPDINKWYFATDGLHPTNNGHKLMADSIMNVFEKMDAETADTDNIPANIDDFEPLTSKNFEATKMIVADTDLTQAGTFVKITKGSFTEKDESVQDPYYIKGNAFPVNWMRPKDCSSDTSFKIQITAKNLLVVYKKAINTYFGSVDMYVDNVKKETLDGKTGGWNNAVTTLAFSEDTAKFHTVEFKVAAGCDLKAFTLLAFGYNI